jgi:hypothetical protein
MENIGLLVQIILGLLIAISIFGYQVLEKQGMRNFIVYLFISALIPLILIFIPVKEIFIYIFTIPFFLFLGIILFEIIIHFFQENDRSIKKNENKKIRKTKTSIEKERLKNFVKNFIEVICRLIASEYICVIISITLLFLIIYSWKEKTLLNIPLISFFGIFIFILVWILHGRCKK